MKRYVLIVDDNEDAREILRRVVMTLGIDTRTAADGIEALEEVKHETPALILLDLMMPRMSGFEVLSYLRAIPELRSIPVMVITGASADSDSLQLPGVKKVFPRAGYSVLELQQSIRELMV